MGSSALSFCANLETAVVHGSFVEFSGKGLLIVGASGAGKSGLALQLMAHGAKLVSDDRVQLNLDGPNVVATAPPAIRGLIEARGVGLLRADTVSMYHLSMVVDLDQTETQRLPDWHHVTVLRQSVPLLRGGGVPHLAASLVQLLKSDRVPPEWPSQQ